MTDLGRLIEAVEAGSLPEAVFHGCSSIRGHWAYTTGLNAEQRRDTFLAYNGSLDAAKRLHDALLPGWSWWIGHDKPNIGEPEIIFAHVRIEALHDGIWSELKHEATSTCAARSWLLAILRAVKAKGVGCE